MKLKEEEVVAYLVKEYPGPVAARGLWTWAGGQAAEMVFEKPARAQWEKLWALAGEEAPPSRIALLREALFDHPGDAALLGFLDAVSDDTFAPGRPAAGVLFFLFEKLAPEFDDEGLKAALTAFPLGLIEDPDDPEAPSDERVVDAMLAAAASSFQGAWDKDGRETLEEKCRAIVEEDRPVSVELIVAGMKALCDNLPDMTEAASTPEAKKLAAALEKTTAPLPGKEKEKLAEGLKPVAQVLKALKARADASNDAVFRSGCAILGYQYRCLAAVSEDVRLRSLRCPATAVIQALWGTQGA